tara:strand:+ start:24809 stop:25747 length:939 start_codon:yes stop_codon:yes gene_type:complete
MQAYYSKEKFSESQDLVMPNAGIVWFNAGADEPENIIEFLKNTCGTALYERHQQDLQSPHHSSFYDSTENYDTLIIQSLDANLMVTACYFIIGKNYVLSINYPDKLRDRIVAQMQKRKKLMNFTADILAILLVNELIEAGSSVRKELSRQNASWQQRMLKEQQFFKRSADFLAYKSQMRDFHMMGEDQEDVIVEWQQSCLELNENELLSVRFSDLIDHAHRSLRAFEKLNQELDSLIQIYSSLISNRTNQIMKVLAIVSVIFLPLNLITGIFGMNFKYMPTLDLQLGYYGTLGCMSAIVLTMLVIFKWRKWF